MRIGGFLCVIVRQISPIRRRERRQDRQVFVPRYVAATNDLKHRCGVIFREYGVDLDILEPVLVSAPVGICTLKRLGQYRGWGRQ